MYNHTIYILACPKRAYLDESNIAKKYERWIISADGRLQRFSIQAEFLIKTNMAGHLAQYINYFDHKNDRLGQTLVSY